MGRFLFEGPAKRNRHSMDWRLVGFGFSEESIPFSFDREEEAGPGPIINDCSWRLIEPERLAPYAF